MHVKFVLSRIFHEKSIGNTLGDGFFQTRNHIFFRKKMHHYGQRP